MNYYPTPDTKAARTLLIGSAFSVAFFMALLFAVARIAIGSFDSEKLIDAFIIANPHLILVNFLFIWSWGTWLMFAIVSKDQEAARNAFLSPPAKLYRIQIPDAMERIVAYLRERSFFFGDSWKQKLIDQQSPRLLYQLEFRAPVADEYFSPRKNVYRNLFILDICFQPTSVDEYSEIQFRFEAITEYDFQTIDPIIAVTRHRLESELGFGFHYHEILRSCDEFGPLLLKDDEQPSYRSNKLSFDFLSPLESWKRVVDRAPPIWLLVASWVLLLTLIPQLAEPITRVLSKISYWGALLTQWIR